MSQRTTLAPDGPARPECTVTWSEEQALTQAVQTEYSTFVQGGAIPLPKGMGLRAEEGRSVFMLHAKWEPAQTGLVAAWPSGVTSVAGQVSVPSYHLRERPKSFA
jgi:hypothetical protein